MRSIISKENLGKVIAKDMNIHEQVGKPRWLEWVSRPSTTMADVIKWASEAQIKETQRDYNEVERLTQARQRAASLQEQDDDQTTGDRSSKGRMGHNTPRY